MTTTQDPYAPESATDALMVKDTSTPAERLLAALLDARGANEQGAEPEAVLRGIALELIEAQGAQPAAPLTDPQCDDFRRMPVPFNDMVRAIYAAGAALAAPQPAQEPFGTVVKYRNSFGFSRWPDVPYLDNALACWEVYTTQQAPQPASMTVQEVWEAAGGNTGIKATRRDVLDALKMLDAVCDDAAPQPAQEPVAWLVCSVNSDGALSLEHAAAWEEAAHEHINDAITEHGIEEAAAWVVRPAYTTPQALQPAQEPAANEQAALIVRGCCEAERANPDDPETICINVDDLTAIVGLYTTPQAPQPLTPEEIDKIYRDLPSPVQHWQLARAIEAAHGITKGPAA